MGFWRLALAYMVIASHTRGYQEMFSLDIGGIAVAAFFFVSGFLMPMTYAAHYQKHGVWLGIGKFYWNRILRLYPIYWASLFCILGLQLAGYLIRGYSNWQANALSYAQNFLLLGLNQSTLWGGDLRFNNPAWSLDVELQYYLVAPVLVLLANKSILSAQMILGVATTISLILFFDPIGVVDVDRSLLAYGVFFVLGFSFYQSIITKKLHYIFLPLLITTLAVVIAKSTGKDVLTFLITIVFIAISAALLILQSNQNASRKGKLAGDLSYPVYIFHIVFIGYIELITSFFLRANGVAESFGVNFVAHILFSTLVSMLALKFIAIPIESLRARIRD
jgi:peptidoglycan/LPS O-acetylase OafA/YrhL